MTESQHELPVLPAYDTGLHYAVYCKHCRCWHLHGRTEGHRAAHCCNQSQEHDRGYVLVKVGDWPAGVKLNRRRKPLPNAEGDAELAAVIARQRDA